MISGVTVLNFWQEELAGTSIELAHPLDPV